VSRDRPIDGAPPAGAGGSNDGDVPAGDFSTWVVEMQSALRGGRGSAVPCDGCTACCTASQFVHIGPDETETLSHIPAELRFPAPGLPSGHVVLGYDEHGRCPMLIDNQCSIYDHRPRTCRTYDCRVFPAAGLRIDDDAKVLLARRAERWRFSHPTELDRNQHAAVRAAATFLRDHAELLPPGSVSTTTTGLAVQAVAVHDAFLRRDETKNETSVVDPDPDLVGVELTRRTKG
jgi:uncharacterized protein